MFLLLIFRAAVVTLDLVLDFDAISSSANFAFPKFPCEPPAVVFRQAEVWHNVSISFTVSTHSNHSVTQGDENVGSGVSPCWNFLLLQLPSPIVAIDDFLWRSLSTVTSEMTGAPISSAFLCLSAEVVRISAVALVTSVTGNLDGVPAVAFATSSFWALLYWEKPRKPSVGIVGLRAEILNQNFPNTKQLC